MAIKGGVCSQRAASGAQATHFSQDGRESREKKMYRILICDDEKEILKDLQKKLQNCFGEQNLQAEYLSMSDARELMEFLQTETADVLFLDIDMPYFTGMDIAAYINERGLQTILVFVTSHDALVYQTFAYRPFGFIRKTHMDDELLALTERICKELMDKKQELLIFKGQEINRIAIKEIVYVESEGNYLNLVTKEEVIKFRETMTNLESELSKKGFIRCHKGYLVNGDYIAKLKNTEMELNGSKGKTHIIPIGRSYEKDVRKKIFEFIRN